MERRDSLTHVVILGSTGSIGRSAVSVIEHDGGARLKAWGLSAHSRWQALAEQAIAHRPRSIALSDPALTPLVERAVRGTGVQVLGGWDGIIRMIQDPETDRVLSAVVGAVGLAEPGPPSKPARRSPWPTRRRSSSPDPLSWSWPALRGARILPVDSEHSAIFQALKAGSHQDVRRVILTSSGGPFRGQTRKQLSNVTPDDALKHPTWQMGPKITIDSATLMNKALEVIEARWLFELEPDQVEVVIHPESVVHSMVEFVDGSVVAQISPPDMRLPIQYALTYPDRIPERGRAARPEPSVLPALRGTRPRDFSLSGSWVRGDEARWDGGRGAQRRQRVRGCAIPRRRNRLPGHFECVSCGTRSPYV